MLLTDQLPAAHHEDLHAGLALRFRRGDKVHIDARTPDDLLAFGHAAHRHDAIAQMRGGLVVQATGRVRHLRIEPLEQPVLLAFEKQHDLVDELVVFRFALIADARREAAFDVILQAGPLPFSVDRFATGAQRKDHPHEVDQFAQAVSIGVRAEVTGAVVAHDPREHHAWKRLVRYLEVRIALVVAQANVERRLVAFDQVRLEDERLDLVVHDDPAHVDDAFDHLLRARREERRVLKVRTDPIAQRDRFSDVQNSLVLAQHQIDAGGVRHLAERLFQVAARALGRARRRHPQCWREFFAAATADA